jgi:uncharacterized membrane protein
VHAIGNIIVLALTLGSLILRRRALKAGVPPGAMALSAIVAGLLVVTGWYGGELAFRWK